jgi:hypothetical protein
MHVQIGAKNMLKAIFIQIAVAAFVFYFVLTTALSVAAPIFQVRF